MINKELYGDNEDEYKGEAAYRKPYQYTKMYFDNVFAKQLGSKYGEEILAAENRLFIEKQKIRDERNEISRILREQARRESFIDLVRNALAEDVKPFDVSEYCFGNDNTGEKTCVVHLTDIHTGLGIENSKNVFNGAVLEARLQKYISEICHIADTHDINKCVLVVSGDTVSGLCHTNLRLEQNEHVISQVKTSCKLIAEFVSALRKVFDYVEVCSVAGNHGRLSPDKESHLNGEELDALVPFYLKAVFAKDNNTHICEHNSFGDYIASFYVNGHLFAAVHGDNDDPSRVTSNMTKILGMAPEVIMMGHRHYNAMYTEDETKIIQSGSVSGTDRYAYSKRLFSPPEQTVIITSERKAVECLYDVCLK